MNVRWTLEGPEETISRSLARLEEAIVRTGREVKTVLLEAEAKGPLALWWWKAGHHRDLW